MAAEELDDIDDPDESDGTRLDNRYADLLNIAIGCGLGAMLAAWELGLEWDEPCSPWRVVQGLVAVSALAGFGAAMAAAWHHGEQGEKGMALVLYPWLNFFLIAAACVVIVFGGGAWLAQLPKEPRVALWMVGGAIIAGAAGALIGLVHRAQAVAREAGKEKEPAPQPRWVAPAKDFTAAGVPGPRARPARSYPRRPTRRTARPD